METQTEKTINCDVLMNIQIAVLFGCVAVLTIVGIQIAGFIAKVVF
jgi:hypothetical protein